MSKKNSNSKFLSLILRHEPGTIGIELDENGWVDTDLLLGALARHGKPLSREALEKIVYENDKQRFAFSDDKNRIRANQGHSVKVDLALLPQIPPELLYHGTVEKFLPAIFQEGLQKGERHHVHLSADLLTATKVGERRGQPKILEIRAGDMSRAGYAFYKSENGVWLSDAVPALFINKKDQTP